MHDLVLSELLASRGFKGKYVQLALDELCRHGLTRPSKTGIAKRKLPEVDHVLNTAFVRHCRKPDCLPPFDETRQPIQVSAEHCEACGGSDNRREVERMLTAMKQTGRTKLLVVGGSPGTRHELKRLCAARLDLQFVTDGTTPNRKTVKPRGDRADVAIIWGSTEIPHKATALLRGKKIITVAKRGIAALAREIREYCTRAT